MSEQNDNEQQQGADSTINEQAIIREMLGEVALLYGFRGDDARRKTEGLVAHLKTLKLHAEESGYNYGMRTHHMPQGLINEMKIVGEVFLRGSTWENREDRHLDAGMDIFKTIVVEPDTPEFDEWRQFLQYHTKDAH